MSDPIERPAVIEIIRSYHGQMPNEVNYRIWEEINELSSAEPEIIRCKDCKHWREGVVYSYCDILHRMGVLDIYDYMTSEDDFCSMAERRSDEEN